MTDMVDRRKSFELKYAYDAEMRFNIEARRNKMLGEWAASLMGRSPDEARHYAKEVIVADIEEVGDEDVLRKVYSDLQQAGVSITKDAVREKMCDYLDQACRDVQAADA